MATFGERLIRAREQRGWNQQELAARAGIRYETISRIENGVHKEPRVYVAVALAKALGTTVDYLVGMYEEDEREREDAGETAPSAATPREDAPATPPTRQARRPRHAAPAAS